MTIDQARKYIEFAREMRRASNHSLAGAYYAAGAYGYLMNFRQDIGDRSADTEPTIRPTMFGQFTRNLLLGGLCYRLTGDLERCENVCRQGILVAEEIRDHEPSFLRPERDPPIGFCYEVIGDFRLVSNMESYTKAYDRAIEKYETARNPAQWCVEPEFELQIIVFNELASGVDYDLDRETKDRIRYRSLLDRIHEKQDHFPRVIDAVLDRGNWDSTLI